MAIVAGLLIAGPLSAAAKSKEAKPKPVKITWHGQSWFEITSSKGTNVTIDPHAIIEYGKIDGVRAHLILSTHFHNDHTQYDSVENYKEKIAKWKKPKVIEGLKREDGRVTWNEVNEKFKDFRIRTVGSYHDNSSGLEKGLNAIFILEVDGLHIVHLGDVGQEELTKGQVKAIGPVDVLMIPVGGVYTINGEDARTIVKQLKPKKYIIPMHCATNAYDDLLPPTEFLEDQDPKTIERVRDNLLEVTADFKPRKPQIVVLNWEPGPRKKRGKK
jgi:L-ascorbate metabolism protein UlaG (beta-lactamase superfamily)